MFVLAFCLLKVTGEVYTVPESNESFDWSAIITFVAKMTFFSYDVFTMAYSS